ncbi:lipoprotein BA_5634 family protein [Bacillus sp. JJ722]|uniref:lipoprotein BA_5634 family protein n=1 Tax=Bacillus sp. JJ722 TaxID=3122973 RepID=UPI002FFE1B9C
MKKWLILLISLCSFTALAGCSLVDKVIGERANGIILYGNKENIESDVAPLRNELKSFNMYETKMTESNAQKIMVMDETTAQSFLMKGLFREVKDDEATIIKSLPSVKKEQGVLFAKDEIKNPEIEGKTYATKYEGNIIIGSSRSYADAFMIVDNEIYKSIQGESTNVGVLLFKSAKESETSMNKFKEELSPQLVTITLQKG